MSGQFTRKMYDDCATHQYTKQSTSPLDLTMDVTKFVHQNNICRPSNPYPDKAVLLVDVESSLRGIDKVASDCDETKHPFCTSHGCLLTKDPRVAPHITPYACERGPNGSKAVITTNMTMPKHPGYHLPSPNVCGTHKNGYYTTQSNNQLPKTSYTKPLLPSIRHQQTTVPVYQST